MTCLSSNSNSVCCHVWSKCYSWFLPSLLNFIVPMGFAAQSWNGTIPCGQINDKFEHCFSFSFRKEENRVRRMPLNWEYFKFFWPWTPDIFLLSTYFWFDLIQRSYQRWLYKRIYKTGGFGQSGLQRKKNLPSAISTAK